MLIVDGKRFTTYDLDSRDTIKNRIAVEKKTLPEYISYTFSTDEKVNATITTQTILQLIKGYKPLQFEKFYKENKELFNIDFETLSYLWYTIQTNDGEKSDPYIEHTIDEFLLKNNFSMTKLKNGLEEFKKTQKRKLKTFLDRVEKEVAVVQELQSHEPIYTTPIEVVKVKTEVLFEVDYDIFELFNHMKMSRDVPFAVIGEYYKIFKDFIPLDRWTYSRERLEGDFRNKREVLYLKTLNVRNEPIKNFQRTDPNLYSTVSIFFETPQEETKRKRLERLKKEEEKEREHKKVEKERKKEERKRLDKEEEKKWEEELKETMAGKKKKDTSEKDWKKEIEKYYKQKRAEKKQKRGKEKLEAEEKAREEILRREKELEEEGDVIVKTSRVYLRVDSSVNPEFNEDELIDRILSTFPSKIHIQSKKQVQIKAEFLVPQFSLDRPLFLDLTMTDPVFSRSCFVDERPKLQKEKGGIYLHFAFNPNDSEDKLVTCSMTEQVVEKTSLKIIAKDPKKLKVDTSYLKVRITKALDKEQAEKFKNLFSRLIALYQTKKTEFIKLYSKYIPDVGTLIKDARKEIEQKRRKSTRTKKMLKDDDPDLFISGSSRHGCPAPRVPKIIATKEHPDDEEPEEVTNLGEKNIQVMLFPKQSVDGEYVYKQHYYACNHNRHDKFPGLQRNKLANSDKFPIAPCCFKKDHRSKKKSIWREYYEEGKDFDYFRKKFKEKETEKEDDKKHIITTNKILDPSRYGVLAKDIRSYFASIDSEREYLRQGVTRSYNSVIEVLMKATDPDFDDYKASDRQRRVEEIRDELVEMVENSNVYQEAYMYTPDTIKLYLKDKKKYLDPKIFIRILEDYFKRYIFIFSQNEQNPYGILSCPVHVKEYLEYKKKSKTRNYVFIYEHMGSELDNAEYPQCELIVQVDKSKKEYDFKSNYEVVARTNDIFNIMYFTNDKDRNIVISFTTSIVSQDIDYHGKTRFIQFDNDICILTDPLPPILKKQGCIYKPISWSKAKKFLDDEKIIDRKEYIVNGSRVGVHASKGGVKFYIPLKPEKTENENQVEVITPTFIFPKSELSVYNEYHRRARCLTEYMLYLFSLDYRQYKPEKIDSEYIIDFVNRNILIDKDFKYGDVPRLFSMNTGLLYDKKLVLHNDTILKKLLYVLRIKLRNNIEEVKNYSDYKYIQHYYADVKDFTQTESQPILFGQHALRKWIDSKKPVYPLRDSIYHTGSSLISDLSIHDTSKPFVIVFFAEWDKPSRNLLNRIFTTKKKAGKKVYTDLYTKYSDNVNFVYVDINKNKGLASDYNVSSVPYIYIVEVKNERLVEHAKIVGVDNTYENVKLIEKEIKDLLE